MANATQIAAETASPAALSGQGSGRLLGLAIVCIAPAVFWIGLLALAGWLFGFSLTASTLAGGALAIGGFLCVVFSALTLNPRT